MNRRIITWLLATVALTSGREASAQYALDRNLQVGSGNVNAPVATPDFAARNLVVTGNVPGGIDFRDRENVNYLAPGAFADTQATDDLFRFRVRSLSVGNIAQQGPAYVNLSPNPVFSGGGVFSAADVRDGRSAVTPFFQVRDASSPRLGVTFKPLVDPALTAANLPGVSTRLIEMPDGKRVQLEYSMMRGLRSVPVPTDGPPPTAGVDPRLSPQRTRDGKEDTDADGQAEDTTATATMQSIDAEGRWAPSIQLGEQILASIQPAQVEADPARFDQVIEKIEGRILGMADVAEEQEEEEEAEAGADVYKDLLKQIEERRQKILKGEPLDEDDPDTNDDEKTEPQTGQDDEQKYPDLAVVPDDRMQLEHPALQKMREAAQARRMKLRKMLNLEQDAAGSLEQKGVTIDVDESKLPLRLNQLLRTIDYELPPLTSMAGSMDSRVNELFQTAESHMTKGKYFRAQRDYRKILEYNKSNPLGMAGLIHAQLGAGMIRSAAYHIRKHFTAHPQLVATRYGSPLLPDPKRLKMIRKQVDRMIDTTSHSEGPLVIAYLGYQTSNQLLVKYGLDLAQARQPRDLLLPVLRRIWLTPEKRVMDRPSSDARESLIGAPVIEAPAVPQATE
jgi:hypothetical protein